MIAFEIMFLMMLSVVAVVTIAAVGRPLAEAYAERMKARYRGLNSDLEVNLKSRLAALEQEVIELRRQLNQIQETSEFTARLLEGASLKASEPEKSKEKQ